eukprot:gene6859-25015_t
MLLLFVSAMCTSSGVPHNHPVHKAPKSLLHRIGTSGHSIANPYHPGHYVDTSARKATVSVTPANFGGDPTGVKDSTEAIRTAIQHCLNQSTLSPNGLFPGSTSFPNQEGIRDMGGCEVNLDGGTIL